MTGESLGSTAMAWKSGFFDRMTSQQPVMVPPVPPRLLKYRWHHPCRPIAPELWFGDDLRIGWVLKLLGIRHWVSGVANSWALSMAPFIPSDPGSAPIPRPTMQAESFAHATWFPAWSGSACIPWLPRQKASAIPVLPLVGSMMMVSEVRMPRFSASSIMAIPIRSLTLPNGLKNSHSAAQSPEPLRSLD